jgi:hypothetical protein
MGAGRQSTKRAEARRNGDLELAGKLAPPSEKPLTDEQRCGALTQKGGPCQQRKGSRTDHPGYGNCAKHGGNTEAGVKSAMKEMGRDLIQEYKAQHLRFGGSRHDPSIASLTPEQALLEEVRRSAAMVRFLEERIAMWNLTPAQEATIEEFSRSDPKRSDPSLRLRIKEVLDSLPNEDPDSPNHLPALTQVHHNTGISSFTEAQAWLTLYREERGHLTRTAKMCIDAGVATRLVSIAEDQGRILASAIRAVLSALRLTPDQTAMIPQVVPPILRAVATDQPIPDISSLLGIEAH